MLKSLGLLVLAAVVGVSAHAESEPPDELMSFHVRGLDYLARIKKQDRFEYPEYLHHLISEKRVFECRKGELRNLHTEAGRFLKELPQRDRANYRFFFDPESEQVFKDTLRNAEHIIEELIDVAYRFRHTLGGKKALHRLILELVDRGRPAFATIFFKIYQTDWGDTSAHDPELHLKVAIAHAMIDDLETARRLWERAAASEKLELSASELQNLYNTYAKMHSPSAQTLLLRLALGPEIEYDQQLQTDPSKLLHWHSSGQDTKDQKLFRAIMRFLSPAQLELYFPGINDHCFAVNLANAEYFSQPDYAQTVAKWLRTLDPNRNFSLSFERELFEHSNVEKIIDAAKDNLLPEAPELLTQLVHSDQLELQVRSLAHLSTARHIAPQKKDIPLLASLLFSNKLKTYQKEYVLDYLSHLEEPEGKMRFLAICEALANSTDKIHLSLRKAALEHWTSYLSNFEKTQVLFDIIKQHEDLRAFALLKLLNSSNKSPVAVETAAKIYLTVNLTDSQQQPILQKLIFIRNQYPETIDAVLLYSESTAVRLFIASQMRYDFGVPQHSPSEFIHLLSEKQPLLREIGLRKLLRIAGMLNSSDKAKKQIAEALDPVLTDDDTVVRKQALNVLERLFDFAPSAIQNRVYDLAFDVDLEIRIQAITLFYRLSDRQESTKQLIEILKTDRHLSIQSNVISQLSVFIDQQDTHNIIPLFAAILHNKDAEQNRQAKFRVKSVLRYAPNVIGRWPDELVDVLATVLTHNPDPKLRVLAAQSLGKSESARALESLQKCRFDTNRDVAAACTHAAENLQEFLHLQR